MMRDATHYAQQIARDHRRMPGHVPPPVEAARGARWIVHFWPHIEVVPWLPDDTAISNVVWYAHLNHGRWVVDCPCGGSQFACRTDHRAFCVDCLGASTDGKWAQVVWPDDVQAIEDVIGLRPMHMQNTEPGEDVGLLMAETMLLSAKSDSALPLPSPAQSLEA